MEKNNFNLDAYLQRLNYSGEIVPTIDRLEALHRAQIYKIPFELDEPTTHDGLTFRLVVQDILALCSRL